MKNISFMAALLMARAFSLAAQTPTTEQIKSDLVGQMMGGRVNYQAIAKRGWPIGSGAVESACRQKRA